VIFITNVGQEVWKYEQVAEVYRVRWNVEILFKSWKSGICIERMIPDTQIHTLRVEGVLYLMLIYIAWFQMLIYAPLLWGHEKSLSLIKAAKWASANVHWLFEGVSSDAKKNLLYYCCYDTRRRTNATERLAQLFRGLT
jgi:Transposase DDE domain